VRIPQDYAAKLPLKPLVATALPDPGVFKEHGVYTMVGTSNETRDTFAIYQARHRDGPWAQVGSVFSGQPAWISTKEPDRWAPEIHRVGAHYVCIYTARHHDGDLRVALAVAPSVMGPYRDLGPVLQAPHGVIDATIYRDRIIYKHDDNSVGEPTPIFTRPFALSASSFAWTGPPHEIVRSGEGHGGLLEAPSVVRAGNSNWIALSSDFFGGPEYKVWLGRIDDLDSGHVEGLRPLLTSASAALGGHWFGPGHCSLVPEAPGIFSMYFHAWPKGADTSGAWSKRFNGGDKRKPLRVTLAFVDDHGSPCDPYIVEDKP
jgi:hypothetical protein